MFVGTIEETPTIVVRDICRSTDITIDRYLHIIAEVQGTITKTSHIKRTYVIFTKACLTSYSSMLNELFTRAPPVTNVYIGERTFRNNIRAAKQLITSSRLHRPTSKALGPLSHHAETFWIKSNYESQ